MKGTARLVIDEDRRVVIGATFTGPGIAELLHSATVATADEVTLDRLWHAVPSFPTSSEVWLRLLEAHGCDVTSANRLHAAAQHRERGSRA